MQPLRRILRKIGGGVDCLFVIPDRVDPLNCIHVGVSSIAAYVYEEGGFKSHALNTCLFTDNEIAELLTRHSYRYALITLCSGQEEMVKSLTKIIKSVDSRIKIVVGGPHPTVTREDILKKDKNIDFLIVGEGEKACLELLSSVSLSNIKGLIYRDEGGKIVVNPSREYIEDLDEIPPPKLDIYLKPQWQEYPIITSRGCVYRCNFCCSSEIWKHKLRFKSVEKIKQEISHLVKLMSPEDYLVISDDFFNFHKERTLELCGVLKKFNYKYFVRGIRADKVDDEVAFALRSSGCMGCGVGIESVDDNSLRMMNKHIKFWQIERGCSFLMKYGISICGQFIIGNIGDTLETVKRSIEFGKRLHTASFYPIYVLPGTALEKYVKDNNLLFPKPYKVDRLTGSLKEAYIFFETPIFPLEDRIEAIRLADEEGFLTYGS
jgi:anaerobic magnesium-protoporphyrin IX monomethyl ester cyclase